MGWKKWPYWIKGGVIGVLVNIALFLLIFVLGALMGGNALILTYTIVPFVSPYFFGVSAPPQIFNLNLPIRILFSLIIPLIAYFIIGGLIGLILGMIKKK